MLKSSTTMKAATRMSASPSRPCSAVGAAAVPGRSWSATVVTVSEGRLAAAYRVVEPVGQAFVLIAVRPFAAPARSGRDVDRGQVVVGVQEGGLPPAGEQRFCERESSATGVRGLHREFGVLEGVLERER